MSDDQSTVLDRIMSVIKDAPRVRRVVLNRELGFLTFLADGGLTNAKKWATPFIFQIDLQPPWGYCVEVSPFDEIVVEKDEVVAKMIDYVAESNKNFTRLSRLNFDPEFGVSSVCALVYDESPNDDDVRLSLTDPAELLASSLKALRAIAAGNRK